MTGSAMQSTGQQTKNGLLRRLRSSKWRPRFSLTLPPAVGVHISNSPPRTDTASRSRRVLRARYALNSCPLKFRGRRECRALNAPAASRAMKKAHEHSHHGHTGNDPAFPAQWFYGFLRALPGDHACLTPSPALLLADLTPALGRQNHTTWPYVAGRARLARCHVHRIPPRVRDDREPPLCGTGRCESVN
jgi:hypothetical protein